LIFGIIFAVLGVFSCLDPVVGAVTISVFVGISFIAHGFADLYILYKMKKLDKKLETIAETIESKIH